MTYPRKYPISTGAPLDERDWNAMVDVANGRLASGAFIQSPCDFIVRMNGGFCEALDGNGSLTYGGDSDEGTVDGSSVEAVAEAAMGAATAGHTVMFYGDFDVDDEITIPKALVLVCYGATFTWDGGNVDDTFIFRCDSELDGLKIYGGTYESTYEHTYPFLIYAKNGWLKDAHVNHTIFTTYVFNFLFQNITQDGDYGDGGHDYGINLNGNNIWIDGFFAYLTTEYQAGFVINYQGAYGGYDNIYFNRIYVRGVFGSFIHWYIPEDDAAQKVGGKTVIENFRVEYTGAPKNAHFATFFFCETEGVTGTIQGNYGDVYIRNGEIIGPGADLTGTVNAYPIDSLARLCVDPSTTATVNLNVDTLKIKDMVSRDAGDTDYLTYLMAGQLILRNIYYEGAWDVAVAKDFGDLTLKMTDCTFEVDDHAVSFNSSDAGTSHIYVRGTTGSYTMSAGETVGHTMHLDISPVNEETLTISTGSPTYRRNGATNVSSGNGVDTTVVIPHYLEATPTKFSAVAVSADARIAVMIGVFADDTHLTCYFNNALANDTNNVSISWYAEV